MELFLEWCRRLVKKNFGAFVDLSKDIINAGQDFFFGGWEQGIWTNLTIGDDSKPFSVHVTNASEWWKFWEYQVGFKINIGKFSCSMSMGIGETNTSFGWDNDTLDIQIGINKIGLGTSHTSNGITTYNQYYIRTVPTVLAVVAVIMFPQILPAGGPAVVPALGFI